jgi:hypothetical protein
MNTELHDLIPLHALHALESDQVHHVEGYINSNPEARVIHTWYLETVTLLAQTVPVLKPPSSVKARVLERIHHHQVSARVRRRNTNGRTGGSNVGQ